MPTSYPSNIDNFTNPTATDTLDSATVPHASQHTNINDAVEAIEGELGTNPKGSFASVKVRLDAQASDSDQSILANQIFGQGITMATYSKVLLSGSTQGKAIKVAATTSGSAGTTIHATGTSTTTIDEVWLYAYNSSASSVTLTIQWGGVTAVDNEIKLAIPATSGLTLVIPGLILTGTGAAANTIAAYAGTTNVITISGYVNRIA